MNWPVVNGDSETGLTIFWVDEGIDTGPVLLQRTVEIRPDDTMGSLYFQRLYPLGIEALAEATALVREGPRAAHRAGPHRGHLRTALRGRARAGRLDPAGPGGVQPRARL